MARRRVSLRAYRKSVAGVAVLAFVFAFAPLLLGQATPWNYTPPTTTWTPPVPPVNNVPNPGTNTPPNSGTTWTPPSSPTNLGSILNAPNPNVPPTIEQTRWYVNNHPDLRNLDPGIKEAIIYGGAGSGLVNGSYLPNGRPNPFTQPNWYLPTTWPASGSNWQGVQASGFMPTAARATYSSFSSSFNPSSVYTSTSLAANLASSRPIPQPPSASVLNRQQQVPDHDPVQFRIRTTENPNRSFTSPVSNIAKAIEDAERTESVHEAAGDKVAQAIDHAELAGLYSQNGNFERASEHIEVAERMANAINDPKLQADLLTHEAEVRMLSGDFEQAISAYQKAVTILRSVGDEKGQAEVYASVGWANQLLGNTPVALQCYEAALYLFRKIGDKDGEVRILTGMGSLYQSIGEFERAVTRYQSALPNASADQQARMLVSVAEMELSRNEPMEATQRYEAALKKVQSTGDASLQGTILAGLGRCLMTVSPYRAYRDALDFFERARGKMKDAGNRAGEAGIIASIGELDYEKAVSWLNTSPNSDFSLALKNYNEALPLMRAQGDRMGEIGVLTNIGLVFDAWGRYERALDYYLQALQKMDELQTAARIEEFRIDLANQSAGLYQRAILLEVLRNHTEEAFNLSERARARAFLDELGNRRIQTHLSDDFVQREDWLRKENISLERRLGQELSKPAPQIDEDKIQQLESQRSKVQHEYFQLVSELKVQNPEYASFLSVSPLTLQQAQQQLEPDVTAVSYFTTPAVTIAFVLTRDSFHVSKLAVTNPQLAWTITTLLDFSGDSGPSASLKLLHKALIAPIKSQLKTARLAVVPFGVLHDVPFAALTPDGKRYLSDEYTIFSLPSLSVLPYIRANRKASANQALVMANDQEEGLPYLGDAEAEAREVASVLNAKPLLGAAATVSALQKTARDSDIIHIIAHFDHDKRNPEVSRVILNHGKNEEGALELKQVYELDLRKTSLVVLSGCQSQVGKLSRGDDIVGLSRAFLYAGSPSVIASLWSVDDEATRTLMVSFYTHLRKGLAKADALRAAQMDLRQKFPHPYYWAGFVLNGDPGNVGLPVQLNAHGNNLN